MLAFFAFDWVFIILCLLGIGLTIMVEALIVPGAIGLSLIILTLALCFHPELTHFIKANPGTTILYIVLYVVLGVLWSVVKWIGLIRKLAAKLKEVKEQYADSSGNVPQAKTRDFLDDCSRISNMYGNQHLKNSDTLAKSIVPKATENKAKITFWMFYWVPSLIGTVFHDWIYNLFGNIFDLIKAAYQSIANWVFSSVIKDIEAAKHAHHGTDH